MLFRLTRQWMKERGINFMALSVEFLYLAARLARPWIKERVIIDMRVRANEPARLVHGILITRAFQRKRPS